MVKKSTQSRAESAGFTLVELLIVISIIGVLSRFLFVNYAEVRIRGRDSQRKSELAEVKKSLRLFYNDYQTYPADNDSGDIIGCGVAAQDTCSWGAAFETDTTTYMAKLPLDPVNVAPYEYVYEQGINGESFTLTTKLEGLGDESAVQSQIDCGVDVAATVDGEYMVCAR